MLHAAAIAAVVLALDRAPPAEPPPDQGVEIVWDQTTPAAVSMAEADEPPGAPPSVAAPDAPDPAEPPPPPPVAAAPPPPAPPPPPPLAQNPPPPLDLARMELPAPNLAVAPPPPPVPDAPPRDMQQVAAPPPVQPLREVQQAEAPPVSPPPEPTPEPAARQPPRPRTPPRPPVRPPAQQSAPAPNPGAPQTLAGIGQALGAVVPPAPDTRFQNVAPSYPEAARLRGETGTVGLELSVDAEGRVTAVNVARSSGSPMLDAAARRAVVEWRFRPAARDGVPVAGSIRTSVHFRLQ